ncbi:MAG TPA: hemerythrin domain-containing protein [Dehalococcoidia bacterium]|nr:hemerythrin domain-containing protein [Dehalococcoidia bacterium]
MDALEELKEMHVAAKSAFKKIEDSKPEDRGGIWSKLRMELVLHEKIEEQFVYDPMTKDLKGRDGMLANWDTAHEEQVKQATQIIDQIGSMEPTSDAWMIKVRDLKSALEKHIDQDENQIWPKIRQEWGEKKLQDASTAVSTAKSAGTSGASVADAIGAAMEKVKG